MSLASRGASLEENIRGGMILAHAGHARTRWGHVNVWEI